MSKRKWEIHEIEILQNNYKVYGPKKCGILLNRTTRACQIKARKLNLKYIHSNRWSEELLMEIVKKSKTKSECLVNLGFSPKSSGNFTTLDKFIKIYNIDTSHFTPYIFGFQKNNNFTELPLEMVLVENSTYSTNHLKKKLYKYGLKKRQCELCPQGEIWNGKKMSLILDHINGISDDHRIENLRIVCPNCNATLDTHCRGHNRIISKAKPKCNKCECGSDKWIDSKKCTKCDKFSQRKVDHPSYEQLLQDLKETNYVQTGKKYGVSDNSIRKWIKAYQSDLLHE